MKIDKNTVTYRIATIWLSKRYFFTIFRMEDTYIAHICRIHRDRKFMPTQYATVDTSLEDSEFTNIKIIRDKDIIVLGAKVTNMFYEKKDRWENYLQKNITK